MKKSRYCRALLVSISTVFILLMTAGQIRPLSRLAVSTGLPAINDDDDACAEIAEEQATDTSSWKIPAGGDIVPVRSVQDPYPSLHSVAVDTEQDQVVMSDSNRGSLLIYARDSGSNSLDVTEPHGHIRGPATGMMFIAGVAIDPAHREIFAVNNDIGDRMEVFPYGANGNARPNRVLFVPHGSWGISMHPARDEIAISVEHINSIVIYRREASGGEAPLRVIHGMKTGLADPHGIAFDVAHNELLVANHGNWAPLTRAEASQNGTLLGGKFELPSIRTFSAAASGDVSPTSLIEGPHTQLNWPMGLSFDAVHDEIAVASYGNNSVLIFRRNASGDVAPEREIRGDKTEILGPMGVAVDSKNDELWVTNYRDHSALVFARTANGNVAPKRVIRNAPAGTPAVGFGNPGAVAYDTKREEILVPN